MHNPHNVRSHFYDAHDHVMHLAKSNHASSQHTITDRVSPHRTTITNTHYHAAHHRNLLKRSIARLQRSDHISRICLNADVTITKDKLIRFYDLRKVVRAQLEDLEHQHSIDKIVDGSIAILSLTKATCDAFISLAAALSPKPISSAANVVKSVYGIGTAAGDLIGTGMSGGVPDYLGGGLEMAKSAADFLPGSGDVSRDAVKFLGKKTVIEAQMVKAAVTNNPDELKKSSLEFATELGGFTLETLGKEGAKKFLDIGKAAFDYHEGLNKVTDSYFTDVFQTESRYQSLKSILTIQLNQLTKKIRELEENLRDCRVEFY